MDSALFAVGFAEVIVLVVVIAGAIGGRNEPDPGGERPLAIYLAAAAVVATFTIFAGVGLVAEAVNNLAEENSSFASSVDFGEDDFFGSEAPLTSDDDDAERNAEITDLILGLIVLGVGGGVLAFHDPKQRQLAQNSDGPGLRVAEKAAYILCFSALVAIVVAAAMFVYGAYGAIAPGVAGIGDRDEALRDLITPVALLVTAIGIFVVNWRRVPHRLFQPAAFSGQHSA
jgi:hypothetical protein